MLRKYEINPLNLESNNNIFNKFVKNIMKHGKKSIAVKIMFDTLLKIKEKTNQNPYVILNKALNNVKPTVELKKIVVAGISYRVPILIKSQRSLSLAIKWIINYSKKRKENDFSSKLAYEIIDASKNNGFAIKYKEELNRTAMLNRPYLKYMH